MNFQKFRRKIFNIRIQKFRRKIFNIRNKHKNNKKKQKIMKKDLWI